MSSSPSIRVSSTLRLLGTLCALAPTAGCSRQAVPLLVFAAASTSGPLEEVAALFEADSGQRVQVSFAGSNELLRQLRAGAPADVFLPASDAPMDVLEHERLVVPADRVRLLTNRLVVIVPAGSTVTVGGAADLERLDRLVLADPLAVPAGIYARAWLTSAGVWNELAPKVVPTADVRAALAAVAAGAISAGVVYATDAASSARVKVVYEVPRESTPPIVYPAAALARSRHPAARAFLAYLQGPRARAVFARAGFGAP
jgi:molybdate transport system substrate-binding protein